MDKFFAKFANATAKAAGTPFAFLLCVSLVAIWAASGPIFSFSETWQLVINTATTIVTFLMVFLIQNTQNRDGSALQTKLDELIRATKDAGDEFMGIETLTNKELDALHERCKRAAALNRRLLRRASAERENRKAGASKPAARKSPAPKRSTPKRSGGTPQRVG